MTDSNTLGNREIHFVLQPWDFATIREIGHRITRWTGGATFVHAMGVTHLLVGVPFDRERISAVHEEAKHFQRRSSSGWQEVAAPKGVTVLVPTLRNPDGQDTRMPLFEGQRRVEVRESMSEHLGSAEVHQATGYWLDGKSIEEQERESHGYIFLQGDIVEDASEAWYFPDAELSHDEVVAVVQAHLADAPDNDQSAYYVSAGGCAGLVYPSPVVVQVPLLDLAEVRQ